MTLKSFNVWVILIPIKYSWTFNVVIFLIFASLNADIYASFDIFALRFHNKRLPCLLLYSPEYSLQQVVL